MDDGLPSIIIDYLSIDFIKINLNINKNWIIHPRREYLFSGLDSHNETSGTRSDIVIVSFDVRITINFDICEEGTIKLGEHMNAKYIATIIAFVMVVVGASAVIADDSDATTTPGVTAIHIWNGASWTDVSGNGYNAYQALQSTGVAYSGDSNYMVSLSNSWGSYDDINSSYGELTSLVNVAETETSVWNVIIWTGSTWDVTSNTLGFISPYSDGFCPSANIVMYYGTAIASVSNEILNLINGHVTSYVALIVPTGDEYAYTFALQVVSGYNATILSGTTVLYQTALGTWAQKELSTSDLTNGITIKGYGSNAYAALKNAVGSGNISGTENSATYYGWINTLFSLGTVYDGSNYTYWVQNTSAGHYTDFSMGYYSGISGVPSGFDYNMNVTAFSLSYVLYSYN